MFSEPEMSFLTKEVIEAKETNGDKCVDCAGGRGCKPLPKISTI